MEVTKSSFNDTANLLCDQIKKHLSSKDPETKYWYALDPAAAEDILNIEKKHPQVYFFFKSFFFKKEIYF